MSSSTLTKSRAPATAVMEEASLNLEDLAAAAAAPTAALLFVLDDERNGDGGTGFPG